eukprot:jgi/Mesvir1/8781/Mv02691-RA.1
MSSSTKMRPKSAGARPGSAYARPSSAGARPASATVRPATASLTSYSSAIKLVTGLPPSQPTAREEPSSRRCSCRTCGCRTRDKEALLEEISQLKKANEAQSEELRLTKVAFRTLEDKLRHVTQELEDMENATASSLDAASSAVELLRLKAANRSMKSKLSDALADKVRAEEEFAALKKNYRVSRIKELETSQQVFMDEIGRLRQQLVVSQHKQQQQQQHQAALSVQVAAARPTSATQHAQLRQKATFLEQANDAYKRANAALEARVDELTREVATHKARQHTTLRTSKGALETAAKQADRVAELEAALAEATENAKARTAEAEGLKTRVGELEDQVKATKEKLGDARKEGKALARALEDALKVVEVEQAGRAEALRAGQEAQKRAEEEAKRAAEMKAEAIAAEQRRAREEAERKEERGGGGVAGTGSPRGGEGGKGRRGDEGEEQGGRGGEPGERAGKGVEEVEEVEDEDEGDVEDDEYGKELDAEGEVDDGFEEDEEVVEG